MLMCSADNPENVLDISFVNASIQEFINVSQSATSLQQVANPMLRIYIYLDDIFCAKTEIIERSNHPILDINMSLQLQDSSREIRLDVYDASGLNQSLLDQIKLEDNKLYS